MLQVSSGDRSFQVDVSNVIVAGWTGRNRAAVDHHIQELAELGIAPPTTTPLYYRVANTCVTQQAQIQVLGSTSSGEAEPVLLRYQDRLWLGLGSDHTDRELEAVSVAASKQACPKPISTTFWPWEEICAHLDDLILRCWIEEDGEEVLYQEGSLAKILPLADLIAGERLAEAGLMLCGTLPAIGAIRPASSYQMALTDPKLNRTISLSYEVDVLAIVS